jgi:tRNA-specific 2-thiouridylase
VIEEFADSYLRGETPIPCIRCNQTVKFRDLLDVARDLGAEAMATGHYVRRVEARTARAPPRDGPHADQSWFLFATTPEQLAFLRFPLGGLPKTETRAIAASWASRSRPSPTARTSASCRGPLHQPDRHAAAAGRAAGDIVHRDGRVLGRHEGVTRYTIGQRRGLNVAVGEPLFVVRIDPDARAVIVGPREALLTASLTLKETNWLGDEPSLAKAEGKAVLARVRSTREPAPARLLGGEVVFDRPEEGVAPGQACVLYDPASAGSRVLGGGFIAATRAAA